MVSIFGGSSQLSSSSSCNPYHHNDHHCQLTQNLERDLRSKVIIDPARGLHLCRWSRWQFKRWQSLTWTEGGTLRGQDIQSVSRPGQSPQAKPPGSPSMCPPFFSVISFKQNLKIYWNFAQGTDNVSDISVCTNDLGPFPDEWPPNQVWLFNVCFSHKYIFFKYVGLFLGFPPHCTVIGKEWTNIS